MGRFYAYVYEALCKTRLNGKWHGFLGFPCYHDFFYPLMDSSRAKIGAVGVFGWGVFFFLSFRLIVAELGISPYSFLSFSSFGYTHRTFAFPFITVLYTICDVSGSTFFFYFKVLVR
ncbi:hypothetical protein HOY80DRAFT_945357 [Tuber brumale]|nr:hypothetical protein HOY80DRAFT_945357 [Tuber brumale]